MKQEQEFIRNQWRFVIYLLLPLIFMFISCDDAEPPPEEKVITATEGLHFAFDTNGGWKSQQTFFDFPYPSDLRRNKEGGPELLELPAAKQNKFIQNILSITGQRKGFPVTPVAYFRTTAKLKERSHKEAILPNKQAPVLLLDIDPTSPERGKLYTTVATELEPGVFVEKHTLAVGLYPGEILPPNRTFAVVVMRSYRDAKEKLLGSPKALNLLKAGKVPEGSMGKKLQQLYQPLWETLKKESIDLAMVSMATVFTTGNIVQDMATMSNKLLEQYKLEIKELKLDPDDGNHDRYCEIHGTIMMPQFQKGTPPFSREGGIFEMDDKGLPQKQREKKLPVIITLPKTNMPTEGFPLMMYIHGSGGKSTEVVDRGFRDAPGGTNRKGEGPSYVVAPFGVGTASTAMPANPERINNASDIEYLKILNLKSFRDTFRQGIIESRLFLDALYRVRIPPSVVADCKGISLPTGASNYHFSNKRTVLMGQSMGGMYTNLVGAVEPKIKAIIPTGAGGFWSFFTLHSNVGALNEESVGLLLGSTEKLTFLHPVLHALQTAWEPVEPMVYIHRVAKNPLPNHPSRPIYQPIGSKDSYFPETLLDIMALASGNQQAGNEVWKDTQHKLALVGRGGFANYPISQNKHSSSGKKYTGVVVQYPFDKATNDGHSIAFQLNEVKYQYGCFLSTFIKHGIATVPAPAKLGTPCPSK